MTSPQLGHYRIIVPYPKDLPMPKNATVLDLEKTVGVTPAGDGENFIRLSISNQGYTQIVGLSPGQARKIAHGLIVCAERMENPKAVTGPQNLTTEPLDV